MSGEFLDRNGLRILNGLADMMVEDFMPFSFDVYITFVSVKL